MARGGEPSLKSSKAWMLPLLLRIFSYDTYSRKPSQEGLPAFFENGLELESDQEEAMAENRVTKVWKKGAKKRAIKKLLTKRATAKKAGVADKLKMKKPRG